MIQNLTESLVQEREEHDFEIVLENPVGSLRKRPFMQTVSLAWIGAVGRVYDHEVEEVFFLSLFDHDLAESVILDCPIDEN